MSQGKQVGVGAAATLIVIAIALGFIRGFLSPCLRDGFLSFFCAHSHGNRRVGYVGSAAAGVRGSAQAAGKRFGLRRDMPSGGRDHRPPSCLPRGEEHRAADSDADDVHRGLGGDCLLAGHYVWRLAVYQR